MLNQRVVANYCVHLPFDQILVFINLEFAVYGLNITLDFSLLAENFVSAWLLENGLSEHVKKNLCSQQSHTVQL
jgi:hypothetical protein